MKRHIVTCGWIIAILCQLLLPRIAHAVTVQLELSQFTGDSASVLIDLDDNGGIITGQINVQANPNIGDLRAVFLQVIDESILPGLIITGPLVSSTAIGDDDITSVGNANVSGGGTPGPFDVGIAFGSPGIGSDDIQSTTFFLDHASTDLTLSMFDLSRWAVRMTSVGEAGGPREGSSKLSVVDIRLTGLTPPTDDFPGPTPQGDPLPPANSGIAPIPEPSSLMLLAVAGAFVLGRSRRRHRAAAQ